MTWLDRDIEKRDRRQEIKDAKYREFIFLDLASQAVTMYVRNRDYDRAHKVKA